MGVQANLQVTLDSGATTLCRCWKITRHDGVTLGFTDHDLDLVFGDVTFRASTGLTGQALAQTTGMSVDNSEAIGALSDVSVREIDIAAGHFDAAKVEAWLVNWQATDERTLLFRGTLGEIRTGSGAFHAELRGLTEDLNQPQGRVYQSQCGARLGDGRCRVDLSDADVSAEVAVVEVISAQLIVVDGLSDYDGDWFERGSLRVLTGQAAALEVLVKSQHRVGAHTRIGFWEELRLPVAVGDRVRLVAGCDKRASTCHEKFDNFLNFRGFPHVPGEDWMMAHPARGGKR